MTPLSKEEILNTNHWDFVNEVGLASIHTKNFPEAYRQQAIRSMEQFAEQQSRIAAIGFAEFTEKKWMYDDESKTWTTFSKGDSPLTTEELYNLYLNK